MQKQHTLNLLERKQNKDYIYFIFKLHYFLIKVENARISVVNLKAF